MWPQPIWHRRILEMSRKKGGQAKCSAEPSGAMALESTKNDNGGYEAELMTPHNQDQKVFTLVPCWHVSNHGWNEPVLGSKACRQANKPSKQKDKHMTMHATLNDCKAYNQHINSGHAGQSTATCAIQRKIGANPRPDMVKQACGKFTLNAEGADPSVVHVANRCQKKGLFPRKGSWQEDTHAPRILEILQILEAQNAPRTLRSGFGHSARLPKALPEHWLEHFLPRHTHHARSQAREWINKGSYLLFSGDSRLFLGHPKTIGGTELSTIAVVPGLMLPIS